MGLCGDKIAGISMDGRMTKELVISALKDAICYTKATEGCILHSDRGSRYCSLDYQALAKEHGFIRSMSRKGNCWDNAPTRAVKFYQRESFQIQHKNIDENTGEKEYTMIWKQ